MSTARTPAKNTRSMPVVVNLDGDNTPLANLCGPLDENLRQLADGMDVHLARRGSRVTFEGEGKGVRHVKLRPISRLESGEVGDLIDAALAIASPPLPSTGDGPLIIKSISAKQRPRRPAA